ncbi:MAG: hypothetical protein ABIS03_11180, partial [Gemmatimonadaceae bacterium]
MNSTKACPFRLIVGLVAATMALSSAAPAQAPEATGSLRHELYVSSDGESYLRYLQTLGKVPEYPWSSRSFSQRELRRLIPKDSAHPWHARLVDTSRSAGGIRYGLISPTTSLHFNSAFAYGSNDGPIWAGRGLTSAVQGGLYAEWGPVTLALAPMAFRAENSEFPIASTGGAGNQAYANPDFGGVDRPQRFGNSPYSQFDPGESTLRVDLPFISAGASTGNQAWGPGQEFPILLGNNAAGFPHLFVGSSE